MRTALAAAVGALLALTAACGGASHAGSAAAGSRGPVASAQLVPHLRLRPGMSVTKGLPAARWAVSFDVRLGARGSFHAQLGGTAVELSRGSSGWHHVEATQDRLDVDGRVTARRKDRGSSVSFRATGGPVDLSALIISALADRGSLLLHRLAELHARLSPRQFPEGADVHDRLHIRSSAWTSGFWPGALWQASALTRPGAAMFARWALASTLAHFGSEHADTHDVGFIYGESSLAAWRAMCRGRATRSALCLRLKRSVLAAADELRALAASNPGSGTIPTNSGSADADTIIDSTMNIAILTWASRVTGNAAYARLASHHAHVVASLLVRPDGSTAQSVHFDRVTGRVLRIHSHQGLSNRSTWSRGQGWAVYGFAQTAADLHDRGLLRVSLAAARYVERHLPAAGIPRWDYDAPAGAPVDVSAGVITAAGLLHLAAACRSIPGVCADPGRWVALGRRMLAASLTRAADRPPLGMLGSEILNERHHHCWCNGGELIFGLTYALEASRLEQARQ